jgi:lipoprotein-anchoring transpeptidase ErfK/SrfK
MTKTTRMFRAALAAGAVLLGAGAAPVAAHAAVPATTQGVSLTGTAVVHAFASGSSRVVEHVQGTTYYMGMRSVLPVFATHVDLRGRTWLHVRLPYRGPRSGWIVQTRHAKLTTLTFHLVVSIHKRQLTVYHEGSAIARYHVVVGKPSTPTPLGQFFVVEHMRLHNSWANGQWALATSAFSSVLKHFEGGIGQIALHAKASLGDPLGTAASHGCVRLANPVAASLARRIPDGTPLTIQR